MVYEMCEEKLVYEREVLSMNILLCVTIHTYL